MATSSLPKDDNSEAVLNELNGAVLTDAIEMHLSLNEHDVVSSCPQAQHVLIQDHHIRTIQSTLKIRQLPSQGLSFQLWPAATTLLRLLDGCAAVLRLPCPSPERSRIRILELGSGTGLVGIAAAAVLGAAVTVTDLPRVIPNLEYNVSVNADVVRRGGGSVLVAPLRWGEEADVTGVGEEFDVLLASDVVYYVELYEPLLKTLRLLMCNSSSGCNQTNPVKGSDHRVTARLSSSSGPRVDIDKDSGDWVTSSTVDEGQVIDARKELDNKGGHIAGMNPIVGPEEGLGHQDRHCSGWRAKRMVFIMAHLRRWKKDSMFFKRAKRYFDVEVVHVDSPLEGCRIGVVVYRFVVKEQK